MSASGALDVLAVPSTDIAFANGLAVLNGTTVRLLAQGTFAVTREETFPGAVTLLDKGVLCVDTRTRLLDYETKAEVVAPGTV